MYSTKDDHCNNCLGDIIIKYNISDMQLHHT